MLATRAKQFVKERHEGHFRVDGEDFFNHLERVALTTLTRTGNTTYMAAAYLHDSVEDGKATLAEIGRLFGAEVGEMVRLLTRMPGVSYKNYVRRIKQSHNEGAIAIKIADNEDNLACVGDGAFTLEKEESLVTRWFWSWALLTGE